MLFHFAARISAENWQREGHGISITAKGGAIQYFISERFRLPVYCCKRIGGAVARELAR